MIEKSVVVEQSNLHDPGPIVSDELFILKFWARVRSASSTARRAVLESIGRFGPGSGDRGSGESTHETWSWEILSGEAAKSSEVMGLEKRCRELADANQLLRCEVGRLQSERDKLAAKCGASAVDDEERRRFRIAQDEASRKWVVLMLPKSAGDDASVDVLSRVLVSERLFKSEAEEAVRRFREIAGERFSFALACPTVRHCTPRHHLYKLADKLSRGLRK